MTVKIERVYDFRNRDKQPSEYAVLVDRVWPRGISKAELDYDDWLKEVAPSTELRKWFSHDPQKWAAFKAKYKKELQQRRDNLEALRKKAAERDLTLLYSARDDEHNQAVVLRELLRQRQSNPE